VSGGWVGGGQRPRTTPVCQHSASTQPRPPILTGLTSLLRGTSASLTPPAAAWPPLLLLLLAPSAGFTTTLLSENSGTSSSLLAAAHTALRSCSCSCCCTAGTCCCCSARPARSWRRATTGASGLLLLLLPVPLQCVVAPSCRWPSAWCAIVAGGMWGRCNCPGETAGTEKAVDGRWGFGER
jgi:hypothetical protein